MQTNYFIYKNASGKTIWLDYNNGGREMLMSRSISFDTIRAEYANNPNYLFGENEDGTAIVIQSATA